MIVTDNYNVKSVKNLTARVAKDAKKREGNILLAGKKRKEGKFKKKEQKARRIIGNIKRGFKSKSFSH